MIIEFIRPDLSNILLIINPLEKLPRQIIYSFSIKIPDNDKKINTFKILLQNEISNQIFRENGIEAKILNIKRENPEELKIINSLDSNSIQSSQTFNLIIKFLIAIYYYELSLTNKSKEYIINQNQKSYLIEPEFIENIKTFFNYEKLEDILNNMNKEFDYSNFISQVEKIYEEYKNNTDIIRIPISIDAFKVKNILPKEKKLNNFSYIENFYVLPKIIMEMLETFLSDIIKHSIHSVSHFWKNENLCILKSDQIYISSFDLSKYFNSEYILYYKNIKNLSSDEFEYISELSDIKEYLHLRKVKDYSANFQRIYGKDGNSIGRLIIPNNCESKNVRDSDLLINKIEANKNIKINRSSSLPRGISNRNSYLKKKINNEEIQNSVENDDYEKIKEKNRNNSIRNDKIMNNNFLNDFNKDVLNEPKKKDNSIRNDKIINNSFLNNFINDISKEPKNKENKEDKEKETITL